VYSFSDVRLQYALLNQSPQKCWQEPATWFCLMWVAAATQQCVRQAHLYVGCWVLWKLSAAG
jgi:hypothetical protein